MAEFGPIGYGLGLFQSCEIIPSLEGYIGEGSIEHVITAEQSVVLQLSVTPPGSMEVQQFVNAFARNLTHTTFTYKCLEGQNVLLNESSSMQLIPESEKDSTVHGTQCLAFQTDRGICIRVRIKISPDVAHLNKKMSLLCGLHYTVEENTMSPQRNYSNNGGGFGRSGSSASDSDGRPSMNSNSDRDRDSDATSSTFNSHHSHAGRMSMSSPPGVRRTNGNMPDSEEQGVRLLLEYNRFRPTRIPPREALPLAIKIIRPVSLEVQCRELSPRVSLLSLYVRNDHPNRGTRILGVNVHVNESQWRSTVAGEVRGREGGREGISREGVAREEKEKGSAETDDVAQDVDVSSLFRFQPLSAVEVEETPLVAPGETFAFGYRISCAEGEKQPALGFYRTLFSVRWEEESFSQLDIDTDLAEGKDGREGIEGEEELGLKVVHVERVRAKWSIGTKSFTAQATQLRAEGLLQPEELVAARTRADVAAGLSGISPNKNRTPLGFAVHSYAIPTMSSVSNMSNSHYSTPQKSASFQDVKLASTDRVSEERSSSSSISTNMSMNMNGNNGNGQGNGSKPGTGTRAGYATPASHDATASNMNTISEGGCRLSRSPEATRMERTPLSARHTPIGGSQHSPLNAVSALSTWSPLSPRWTHQQPPTPLTPMSGRKGGDKKTHPADAALFVMEACTPPFAVKNESVKVSLRLRNNTIRSFVGLSVVAPSRLVVPVETEEEALEGGWEREMGEGEKKGRKGVPVPYVVQEVCTQLNNVFLPGETREVMLSVTPMQAGRMSVDVRLRHEDVDIGVLDTDVRLSDGLGAYSYSHEYHFLQAVQMCVLEQAP